VRVEGGVVRVGGRVLSVAAGAAGAGDALLHVRPHAVTLHPVGEGELTGSVTAVRRVGRLRRVDIRLDETGTEIEADDPGRSLEIGRKTGLSIERGRVFSV